MPDWTYLLFFIFIFVCFSAGMFAIGFVAGQQAILEDFRKHGARDRRESKAREAWLKEIERN